MQSAHAVFLPSPETQQGKGRVLTNATKCSLRGPLFPASQYLTVVRSRSSNASALSSPDGFHQGSYEELLRSPQQTVVQPEKRFSIFEKPWLQSVIYRFGLASQVDRRRIKNLEKYQPMSDGLQATATATATAHTCPHGDKNDDARRAFPRGGADPRISG